MVIVTEERGQSPSEGSMAVGLRRDRDEISFRGPRLEVVCHLGSSMTGERAVVSDHVDTSIAYGEETLVEGGVIGQRHATTSEAEVPSERKPSVAAPEHRYPFICGTRCLMCSGATTSQYIR